MIVTEEEALKMLCPMTFSGDGRAVVEPITTNNCAGSECMAWVPMASDFTTDGRPIIPEGEEPKGSCGMMFRT